MEKTVKIIPSRPLERKVEFSLNGNVMDSVLISIEVEPYTDEPTYKVVTWYDTNQPYGFRTKEADIEYKTASEAKKEMRQRCLNWESKFKTL